MKEQGYQHDSGPYWCAIARTPHGVIAGKAKDGTCWYVHGGKEHTTPDYRRVSDQCLVSHPIGDPHGRQNDGGGSHWCAIAYTRYGEIPGKANADGCWYGYGGKEYFITSNFKFVSPRSE
eukprot:c46378_g1_i1.p1 GENE.c46378_g1_i1~~c46378_g1_i1.p1  ORF type:complete len:140 (-),score=20.66 c46378_g1_i1:16-375(-)